MLVSLHNLARHVFCLFVHFLQPCYLNNLNMCYCCFVVECPWAEQLTSLPKRRNGCSCMISLAKKTRSGLPQLQDLYCLPLLPQCRIRAFVYTKFQYGMNICIEGHKYSPKVRQQCMNSFQSPHEYSKVTPLLGHHKMNFSCNPIHCLLETFTGQEV